MIQENIQHGSLPGNQNVPSRWLNEHKKLKHKNNDWQDFAPSI